RGTDITNTPVPRGYAIVKADGSAELFVAREKLTDEVRVHLGNAVALRDYSDFPAALTEYADQKIGVDPERSVAAIFGQLEEAGAQIVKRRDPTILAKAIKNDTEISGHKAAQARDGAALSKFLHWFSKEAPKGGHDELSVAEIGRAH